MSENPFISRPCSLKHESLAPVFIPLATFFSISPYFKRAFISLHLSLTSASYGIETQCAILIWITDARSINLASRTTEQFTAANMSRDCKSCMVGGGGVDKKNKNTLDVNKENNVARARWPLSHLTLLFYLVGHRSWRCVCAMLSAIFLRCLFFMALISGEPVDHNRSENTPGQRPWNSSDCSVSFQTPKKAMLTNSPITYLGFYKGKAWRDRKSKHTLNTPIIIMDLPQGRIIGIAFYP